MVIGWLLFDGVRGANTVKNGEFIITLMFFMFPSLFDFKRRSSMTGAKTKTEKKKMQNVLFGVVNTSYEEDSHEAIEDSTNTRSQ